MRNRRATATNTGGASQSSPSTACPLWRVQSVQRNLTPAKHTARPQKRKPKPNRRVKEYDAAPVEQSSPDKTTDILPSQFPNRPNPRHGKPKRTVETQTDKPAVALKMDSALHAEHKEDSVPALTPALPRARINACTTTNAKHRTTKRRT